MVMPLRYVEIDATDAPLPRCRSRMPSLERATVLVLLHPEIKYGPIDIARILYTWELQQPGSPMNDEIAAARLCYSKMADRRGFGSNPDLAGSVWRDMVATSMRDIAVLMEQLKRAQAANPDRIYCLKGNQLAIYPEPVANLSAPLPPRVKTGCQSVLPRYESQDQESGMLRSEPARVASQEEPVAEAPSPVDDFSEAVTAHEAQPAAERACSDPEPAPTPAPAHAGPPPRQRSNGPRWKRRTLLALALLFLPALLFGYFWLNLERYTSADITELGAPDQGTPFLVVAGKRYEPGDWIYFEGQSGIIKKISRHSILIGDREILAPPLYFLGERMREGGNFVIYPGSPRHIAGNFDLEREEDLDTLEPGYLGWLDGFASTTFASLDSSEVAAFWSKVSGRDIRFTQEVSIVIPEGAQWSDLVEGCTQQGCKIEQNHDQVVIQWP